MRMKIGILFLVIGLVAASHSQAAFFRGLGDIPSGIRQEAFCALSADGSVIVGRGEGVHQDEAFRWTLTDGLEGLGVLPGHATSGALAVSADGQVVVGYSASADEQEAFYWSHTDGLMGLGDLPGGEARSIAYAVSGDGDVVVGAGYTESGEAAFIWIRGQMYPLAELLTERYGLDIGGWSLLAAVRVSADGQTLIGHGINPGGEPEAWVAHIGDRTAGIPLAPPTGLRIVFD